jgi:hypothetical protein
MIIKVNYTVSDVYMSTSISPVYIKVVYSGVSGGGGTWGSITGTLSNQTDLQNALNAKFNNPTGTTLQYIDGTGAVQTFPTRLESDSLVAVVRNQSGATMTKGTIVYISGATGNKPLISKALATGDATSAQTLGLLQTDIANNADGHIVVIGNVTDLNTSALTEGQQLYLSGTTAGTWTTTKPYAPIHLVYVGIVIRSHPTQGTISVKVQNGYEMDELHNVSAQSPANNDGLFWNALTNLWSKNTIAGVLGYTPVNPTRTISTTAPLTGGGDLSANRTLSIPAATSLINGYLTAIDWAIFNAKQAALGFTPVPNTRTLTINGTTFDLSADRAWTISGGGGTDGIGVTLDGQGSTISIGSKGYVTIPYACTINQWFLSANIIGSIVIDVKRGGTSIIGAGNKPTLASAISGNAVVSSWTSIAISAGDIIEWNVDSASIISNVTLTIKVTK